MLLPWQLASCFVDESNICELASSLSDVESITAALYHRRQSDFQRSKAPGVAYSPSSYSRLCGGVYLPASKQ